MAELGEVGANMFLIIYIARSWLSLEGPRIIIGGGRCALILLSSLALI